VRAERIECLEALRALAAGMVLWGHALDYAGMRGDLSRSFAFGADLFFVLSGYIMGLSAESAVSAGDFLRRRAWRILPLYYLATLLEAARLSRHGIADLGERLWRSLLFLPQAGGPVLAVGWTLQFEAMFYLWLAALIAARPREFRLWAALGPAALGIWNPISLLFAFGILLRPLPVWAAALGATLATTIWSAGAWIGVGEIWNCHLTANGANSGTRLLFWGLPAVLVVGAAAGLRGWKIPVWLIFFGRESYGIYLFQHFGLMVAAAWGLGLGGLAAGALAVSLAMSAVASHTVASIRSKYVARIDLGLRRPARLGG
jgi:exopolysaccharide production protein ExoZ